MRTVSVESSSRPLLARVLNRLGRTRATRVIGLEPGELMDAARRRTGLDDFGEETFRERLERLVASLEADAHLSSVGRVVARTNLISILSSRLEVTGHLRRHPEVLEEQIRRPLFIVGLPRSGTTILQALLGRDASSRSLLYWEAARPCPPPRRETCASDPRIREARRQLDRFEWLVPGVLAVHEMTARGPQECLSITAHELMSLQFFMLFDVSSYDRWIRGRDWRPVYAAHRRFLQLLQSGGVRGARWVLKSPAHLAYLHELLETYTDACVVRTHRDPVRCAASLASLTCLMRGASSDRVLPRQVGRQVEGWLDFSLGRAALLADDERCVDVAFADLVRDPVGCVRRIYRRFGIPMTPTTRARMETFVQAHPRGRRGHHVYDAERFGIRGEGEGFRAYRQRFGLSRRSAR
jgi:hypothetical protein